MTRDEAIECANYCLSEDIRTEFEKQEWKAAISNKASFCIYSSDNVCVIIETYVVDEEIMYSVLFE